MSDINNFLKKCEKSKNERKELVKAQIEIAKARHALFVSEMHELCKKHGIVCKNLEGEKNIFYIEDDFKDFMDENI